MLFVGVSDNVQFPAEYEGMIVSSILGQKLMRAPFANERIESQHSWYQED